MPKSAVVAFLVLFHVAVNSAFSQSKMTNEEYISRFKDIAMQKMQEYSIPASITLAQGILESGSGNSYLARKGNNHFGIKCHGWKGRKIYHDDDEANECFRAYRKAEDSYHDHSLFLTQRQRYAFLFDIDVMDYKAWARGLSKAGYATNPRYPELLIRIIERNELYLYDQVAMKHIAALPEKDVAPHKYIPPDQAAFEIAYYSDKNRPVYANNGRKLCFARKGDTFHSLAKEFSIFGWQIVRYNELNRNDELEEGQMLYLERKRRRSQTHEKHTVNTGETMYGIAQMYGIRLKALQRRNNIPDGVQPPAGAVLELR